LPDVNAPELTSLGFPPDASDAQPVAHAHRWLEMDAVEALRTLAALDDSGYAPAHEPLAWTNVPGQSPTDGDGNPHNASHEARSRLPLIRGARPS